MNKLKILFIIPGLFIFNYSYAYDDGDFQIWHTEAQELKINQHSKLALEEEFRWADNAIDLYYHHYDLGYQFDMTKDISLGLNYRHIYEENNGKFKQENRPHLNAIFKSAIGEFKIEDRNRLEYRHFDYKADSWQYRNKLNLKLPWKIIDIFHFFLADEIFVNLNEGELTRNRFYSGTGIMITDNIKAEIYYLLQRSKGSGKWSNANIWGTKLKLAF